MDELVGSVMESPLGELRLVASGRGLVAVLWACDSPRRVPVRSTLADGRHPMLAEAAAQMKEYFAGERTEFSVPLDIRGTTFQCAVWNALRCIPFGQTTTYGELAVRVGAPGGSRAVGAANGRNPLSIVVPCHRVVGASGKLTGFAGGLAAKAYLLRMEAERGAGFGLFRAVTDEKRPAGG